MNTTTCTSIPIFQVDAFAHKPFSGNPAAICLLDGAADEKWMQSIAAEMNLSETAFVYRQKKGFNLRWFTPTIEVDLCGHATLAAAHVLWEQDWLDIRSDAYFNTHSGQLIATHDNGDITLNFPVEPITETPAPSGLLEALDLKPIATEIFHNGTDYMVYCNNEVTIKKLQPNFQKLAEIDMRGVIVTAASGSQNHDFISRFFAPSAGINEDPVTGSAHCALAPFWSERLGKSKLAAYQASSRGGELMLDLQQTRVLITGKAITIFGGQLYV